VAARPRGVLASSFQTLGSEFESLLWHKRMSAFFCVCVVLCRYRPYDWPLPLQRALPNIYDRFLNRNNGRALTALVCRSAQKHQKKASERTRIVMLCVHFLTCSCHSVPHRHLCPFWVCRKSSNIRFRGFCRPDDSPVYMTFWFSLRWPLTGGKLSTASVCYYIAVITMHCFT
jgi:hypothetical protein